MYVLHKGMFCTRFIFYNSTSDPCFIAFVVFFIVCAVLTYDFACYRQDRDRLIIATKCGRRFDGTDPNAVGATRKNILKSVDNSLCRLQTNYIDLLYVSNSATND